MFEGLPEGIFGPCENRQPKHLSPGSQTWLCGTEAGAESIFGRQLLHNISLGRHPRALPPYSIIYSYRMLYRVFVLPVATQPINTVVCSWGQINFGSSILKNDYGRRSQSVAARQEARRVSRDRLPGGRYHNNYSSPCHDRVMVLNT